MHNIRHVFYVSRMENQRNKFKVANYCGNYTCMILRAITYPSLTSKGQHQHTEQGNNRSKCEDHRGINLPCVAPDLPEMNALPRLESVYEQQTRDNKAKFRSDRGCIDDFYTLRQTLGPTTLIFLDWKATFDSNDRHVIWRCLLYYEDACSSNIRTSFNHSLNLSSHVNTVQ